jgi:hypothetical protein
MEHTFTCPKCGGHEFGTEGALLSSRPSRGCCHGYIENPDGSHEKCVYEWDRSKDAELHPGLLKGVGEVSTGMQVPRG